MPVGSSSRNGNKGNRDYQSSVLTGLDLIHKASEESLKGISELRNSTLATEGYTGIFGHTMTSHSTPIVQITNKHRQDPTTLDTLDSFFGNSGAVGFSENLFQVNSKTASNGYALLRSRKSVIYRAGQSIEAIFSAKYTAGVINSYQGGGLKSITDEVGFGFDGADFSIMYYHHGLAEVELITVTGAAGAPEIATVTLDGVAVNCNLTAITAAGNAYEIYRDLKADATINKLWRFEQVDTKVYAIALSEGNKSGAMTFSSATATGTVTEFTRGANRVPGNVKQSSWDNKTPFQGFNPTHLNVYRVIYGYLGGSNILFQIYNPITGKFVTCHTLKFASSSDITNLGYPDFHIGWYATNVGNTTAMIVQGASGSISIQGDELQGEQTFGSDNNVSAVGATLTNLITLKNRYSYNGLWNHGIVKPAYVSVSNDHTKACYVELFIDADVAGIPNFQVIDEVHSISLIDKAGTTVTNGKFIGSILIAPGGSAVIDLTKLYVDLYPGRQITVASKTVDGVASTSVSASIIVNEIR